MAHYLSSAIHAEGVSDHRFLPTLVGRLMNDICRTRGRGWFDVADPLVLDLLVGPGRRYASLVSAAEQVDGYIDLLFMHRDGAGSPDRVRQNIIDPVAAALRDRGLRVLIVPVVPIREMEAWTLADGDAIRAAIGSSRTNAELGLPENPRDVEGIADPKRALADVVSTAIGRNRARRADAARYLDVLAQQVDLDRLRLVPAFASLERDLAGTLINLNFIT